MPARSSTLLGASCVVICALFPSLALAQSTAREHRYEIAAGDELIVSPDALIDDGGGDERMQVVLKMSEQSVAAVKALATNKELSEAERSLVESKVETQHQSLVPQVEAAGGKVLARFAHAFNGVKVEVARKEIARLSKLPGVVQVLPVRNYQRTNATSVPFIGAPNVWGATPSVTGKGVKIAIIDTGVDYTHANFGGPGTPAAYVAACGADPRAAGFTVCPNDAAPAPSSMFGPAAPKVKGGTDLVGDAYTGSNAPVPDDNPLDCGGHGSHTAGTATGLGVTADGKTYTGPYDSAAYTPNKFKIGPGVAPEADLYAVRVFGCNGSTNVVTEAIDWAVKHGMDVISMSLGADWGDADSSDAQASQNAAAAGLIVVAASGNAGPAPYITSSPASGNGVITAAAIDHRPGFPGVSLALTPSGSILAQNSNGAKLADGTVYSGIVVLRNTGLNGEPSDHSISNGCKEADYDKARNGGVDIAGKLVVVLRGAPSYCDAPSSGARVFRAGAGQKYGAAAVALLNTSAGYPPFEGVIKGGDPATNPFATVTIPFLGVRGPSTSTAPSADAAALVAAASATATNALIVNPGARRVASFSSGGPRSIDSYFKPSVSAPGVSVVSTAVATGSDGVAFSGTSMSTPHIAGVAALVRQAHKNWSATDQRAAIMQTADPLALNDYDPRLEGAGLVQAIGSTMTQVVAHGDEDNPNALSFGFAEFLRDHRASREVQIQNHGESAVRFNVSSTITHGVTGLRVNLNRSQLRVGPDSDADLVVTLQIPVGSVGGSHDASGNPVFRDISGYITLTPINGDNNGVKLNLPFYLVPRARSNLFSFTDGGFGVARPQAKLFATNFHGGYAGLPDFYALGQSTTTPSGAKQTDVRAVGVQAIPISATDGFLVFAINTFNRFSNPAPNEFDVNIDTAGGTDPLTTGNFTLLLLDATRIRGLNVPSGTMVSVLIDNTTGRIVGGRVRLVDAPTDGSTLLAVVRFSELGLTKAKPRFTYAEAHFDRFDGSSGAIPGFGVFNAFTPAVTVSGLTAPIIPNGYAPFDITVNPAEWPLSTPAGLMVVDPDNRSGGNQAQLIEPGEQD